MAKRKVSAKLDGKLISKKLAVARKKVVEAERNIKSFVKKNPKKSIAIAAVLAAAVAAAAIIAVRKLRKK